jgi:hypothetical protein
MHHTHHPTGHGWITPDNQIHWSSHAHLVIPDLCTRDPHQRIRLQHLHEAHATWLQDLYLDGHVRIGRSHAQLMFEHGPAHRPDLATCIQARGSMKHQGELLHTCTHLYNPSQPHHANRRRFFCDPDWSRLFQ